MDPRLLQYYNRELQHLREMGSEFAKEFPKIAGRLSLDGVEVADPYVERLLEGFAFLAARVQLKIDAEFPHFTQHLLEIVYPQYLAPTPSMMVVQLQPDLSQGALAEGFAIPRGTELRSLLGKGEQTACEYRTAHETVLWPLELERVDYLSNPGEIAEFNVPERQRVRAVLRLRLRATAGLTFDKLALDRLSVYLGGADDRPMELYERLMASTVGVVHAPVKRPASWSVHRDAASVRAQGFSENEALLPYDHRSFQGYRLLHEYFSFPQRFLFLSFEGLGEAVRRCDDSHLDLLVMLDRSDQHLESTVDASLFSLFCSPAINLFPRRADRIHLDEKSHEYHVVADRTRPLDLEIYSLSEVVGTGTGAEEEIEFLPFYSAGDMTPARSDDAFYTIRRAPRVLSSKQARRGPRSTYVGHEIFIQLVDARQAPFRSDLRQLSIKATCTNRDLPLHLSIGQGKTDFTIQSGAPVVSVRCLAGPTRPRASFAEREAAWRLISQLSLNYLSIVDDDRRRGAAALRQLLTLYCDPNAVALQKQIEGVHEVKSAPIVRQVPSGGPISFGRGLEVTLTCDEASFEGAGLFLFGAVMERFFAEYVSINSFTQMVLRTPEREVHRWPVRIGDRMTL